MADFQSALKIVLSHEGGIADVEGDKGGVTNSGITSAVLPSGTSEDQIRALTPAHVSDVYYNHFWEPLGLDHVNDQGLALTLFDQAVLRGAGTLIKVTQGILGLKQDGIVGPQTLLSINAVPPKRLSLNIIQECLNHSFAIAQKDPTQGKFLKGWVQRCFNLVKYI